MFVGYTVTVAIAFQKYQKRPLNDKQVKSSQIGQNFGYSTQTCTSFNSSCLDVHTSQFNALTHHKRPSPL